MAAKIKGRGAKNNPPGKYGKEYVEEIPDFELPDEIKTVPTQFFREHSRSIISKNDSPDLGFIYSVNPYRGCEHGCIYCYARPFHEYINFSAGLDFETKIAIKENAPQLLEKELAAENYKPDVLNFCGGTEPYQPVEFELELTRKCLEVCRNFGNPAEIVTKNASIRRDTEMLSEMAAAEMMRVYFSISTLDKYLASRMEPRASTVEMRLKAMRELSEAGIPVGVLTAPVIPGLTEHELPAILEAASDSGAAFASYQVLRLPQPVDELFTDWLVENYELKAGKVLNRLMEMRDGKLYNSEFGKRFKGEGIFAESIANLFKIGCVKNKLSASAPQLSVKHFRRYNRDQLELF